MSTAELIDEIEDARRAARDAASVSEADLRNAERLSRKLARDLDTSDKKLREAVKTLRPAGLLK